MVYSKDTSNNCRGGGIGIRAAFRAQWEQSLGSSNLPHGTAERRREHMNLFMCVGDLKDFAVSIRQPTERLQSTWLRGSQISPTAQRREDVST